MRPFEETRIQTERLVLRALSAEDAPAVFEIYRSAEVARYGSRPAMTSLREAEEWVAGAREEYGGRGALRLAVERTADAAVIGTCAFFAIHAQSRRAIVGYVLAPAHWRQGYMREALGALVHYGFDELELNRLEADVDPRNEASLKLLEGLGFAREGYMRERWIVNGEVCDTVFFGLLRRDHEGRDQTVTRR